MTPRADAPRWRLAQFRAIGICGHIISRGERLLYVPATRETWCERLECGQRVSRELGLEHHDKL